MGFRYTSIRKDQIRKCRTCGEEIFFVKNRHGKWFAVDVVYHPGISGPTYKHNGGAYNNMTPWHTCRPQRDFWGEHLVNQAARAALKIAQMALTLYREDPQADQTRLNEIQIRMQARIARRMAALPEGSRAYVR